MFILGYSAMALQGVILYLLVLFPAALLIEDSPNSHPDGPPMACGRLDSVKLLRKKSSNSICCGDEQYSPDTHCCCGDGPLRTEARGCSRCCEQDKNQAPLACCGERPFDLSSAVCCGLQILAHPGALFRCCGGEAYDNNTQLCCGPIDSEKILSKEHQENICCGDTQYSNGTHECLGDPPVVKERPVPPGTRSDRASSPGPAEYRGIETSCKKCGQGAYDTNTQLCCGPIDSEKILSKEHQENICCGDTQYSNGTHECLGDPPVVKERPVPPGTRSDRASSPGPAEYRGIETSCKKCGQGAYDTNTQLCCGPIASEKILSKEHQENICCGDTQYSNGTHECLGDPPVVKERPVPPGTRSDRASSPGPADSSTLPVSSFREEQLNQPTVNRPITEPGGRSQRPITEPGGRPQRPITGPGGRPGGPVTEPGGRPQPGDADLRTPLTAGGQALLRLWTRLREMLLRSGRS